MEIGGFDSGSRELFPPNVTVLNAISSCAGESTSPSVLDDKIRPAPCWLPSWIWCVICKPKTEAVLVTMVTTVSQRSLEKHFPFAGNVWKVREQPTFFFAVRPHYSSLPPRRECGTLESKKIIYRLSCLLTIDSSVLEFLQPYMDSDLRSMGCSIVIEYN